MLEQVNVFYEGWGERWQWGTRGLHDRPDRSPADRVRVQQ